MRIGFQNEDEWHTTYPVVFISRGDLQREGLTVCQVDLLTNQDMEEIVGRTADLLIHIGLWPQIAFIARVVLAEKVKDEKPLQQTGETRECV